jgi:hypothetical protein
MMAVVICVFGEVEGWERGRFKSLKGYQWEERSTEGEIWRVQEVEGRQRVRGSSL